MRNLLSTGAALLPALALCPTLMAATIDDGHIQHVLLISVDGMHNADLANFIAANPASTLAGLVNIGYNFTNANTSRPSDSFPGAASLLTGGLPQDTGLWYDDAWDRGLYQPADTLPTIGAGNVHGTPPTPLVPGIECVLTELIDYDQTRVDAGASLLPPGAIPLNVDYLPRDASTRPVYPHQIIRVNTIFEVAKKYGKRTAWSDKHNAYEWVNGPSGVGVDDFFVREVNSTFEADGVTFLPWGGPTSGVEACLDYDNRKVAAIVNEINGLNSAGTTTVGVPAIFGMNFQAVSVGQKVSSDGASQGDYAPVYLPGTTTPNPAANPDGINGMPAAKQAGSLFGQVGGYTNATGTPSAVLTFALKGVDAALGQMVAALKTNNLYDSTLIIITAKHGQSPIDKTTLRMKAGAGVAASISTLPAVHDPTDSLTGGGVAPGAPALPAGFIQPNPYGPQNIPYGFTQTDTIGLVWFQDNTTGLPAGGSAGGANLATNVGLGVQVVMGDASAANNPDAIDGVLSGTSLVSQFDDPTQDPRTPDIIIIPHPGVIYSGSTHKYMEHGGFGQDDSQVVMLLANPAFTPTTVTRQVYTTSVAPTILKTLGMDPNELQAVANPKNHPPAPVLPGIGMDGSSPPAAITDLSAQATGTSTVLLTWTATTSSGPTGSATSYDVRWSSAPITDNGWDTAASVGAGPAAMPAGSSESMTVSGLPAGTAVYFAARAIDANGSTSELSNGASATTQGSSGSSSGCGSGSGIAGLVLSACAAMALRLRIRTRR
jgi:arylsulfatase A-like enzyme